MISQPIVEFKQSCQKHEDSVIDSVDTGFGECKTIENSCPKPTFKSHLYKENYLSEFKTETEKALARNHLGVYGKSETVAIIKQEMGSLQSFIKKEEVEKMIADLDFVNSTLKAFADYQIPEKLFKLWVHKLKDFIRIVKNLYLLPYLKQLLLIPIQFQY